MTETTEELRIRRLERQLTIDERKVKQAEESIAALILAAAYLRQAADNDSSAGGACGGTVTIGVRCLTGQPGYTVTISQGATSFTGVTSGAGTVTFTPGASGSWGYSVSGPGISTITGTFTFSCVNLSFFVDIPNAFNHTVSGNVTGCNLVPLSGATLTLKQGSTTIGTATTDSAGNYSISWTAGGSNSYTLYCDYTVISPARFVQTSVNIFTTLCQSLTVTRSFNLGPTFVATGYHCDPCGGAIPIKDTLTCTPPFGPAFTLSWSGPGLIWAGSHAPTYTASDCAGGSETKTSTISWVLGGYTDSLGITYPCALYYGSKVCGAPPPCTIRPDDDATMHPLPITGPCERATSVAATSASSHTNYPFIATFAMPNTLGTIAAGTATITE